MNQTELILKTYREVTNRLQKPYYILEGLPSKKGRNNMLYSSPGLKDVIGLTQLDLSSNPEQFFDSIHPDYINNYLESNQRLLKGSTNEKRIYLVKNKEKNTFVPIEEIASSRLNEDRNCYEIYCSLRSITSQLDEINELTPESISKAFAAKQEISKDNIEDVYEISQHLVDTIAAYYKTNGCRFYGFNFNTNKLTIFAEVQNKKSKQLLESSTRVRIRNVVPNYSPKSLLFDILLKRKYTVLESKEDIIQIIKDHTDSTILKKIAATALKFYSLKSFGIIPICCPDGRLVGMLTYGSPDIYSEKDKKDIYDLTITTANTFICSVGAICNSK